MKITVIGAGAFGTSLALAWSSKALVTLWGRSLPEGARQSPRLPGVSLPSALTTTNRLDACPNADILVVAASMAGLSDTLTQLGPVRAPIVLCAKGRDPASGLGPSGLARRALSGGGQVAILSGPSFAVDIASGLPTALAIACEDETAATELRDGLSTPQLRLYSTTDVVGAELGGALKNVIALAAGVTMGAGLGESARAAIITRGFAEMSRYAQSLGGRAETLAGLSGLGDLLLTATSAKSRNYRYGFALGAGDALPEAATVEGVLTARALAEAPNTPITQTIAALIEGRTTVADAIARLMERRLTRE
ncbi:MAG: NAD(P)H-dependent glycerol-3-phosphate dehydrogenase [Pseudomonadota bacterium]